jgi:hypothetical protein
MADDQETRVASVIDARLQGLQQRLAPSLLAPLADLFDRHHFGQGDLFHPLGQPVAALPIWTADLAARASGHPVPPDLVDDLIEATVVGYLYVRTQDDFFDGRLGQPEETMLLADALLFRHVGLLGRVGASPRFWAFHEQTAMAYAEAMLYEHEVLDPRRPYGPSEFDRVLARSAPLALGAAALLDLFDCWQSLPQLQEVVHHIVRSGQLVDDLRDALADFDNGHMTWVVRRLGGLNGRQELMEGLGLGGGFGQIIDEAQDEVDRALGLSAAMGLGSARPWLESRKQAIAALHENFLRHLLTPSASASPPSPR